MAFLLPRHRVGPIQDNAAARAAISVAHGSIVRAAKRKNGCCDVWQHAVGKHALVTEGSRAGG